MLVVVWILIGFWFYICLWLGQMFDYCIEIKELFGGCMLKWIVWYSIHRETLKCRLVQWNLVWMEGA